MDYEIVHSGIVIGESFGLERLACWHARGMRSLALSGSMMLSGIQDGKGSGTGESLAEIGYSLGCLLGCLLVL